MYNPSNIQRCNTRFEMGKKFVLVSKKNTESFVSEKRARSFEKQKIAEEEKLYIPCEIQVEVCFLATSLVFFQPHHSLFLDTNHQRFVPKQARTSFQEWKQTSFFSTNTAKQQQTPQKHPQTQQTTTFLGIYTSLRSKDLERTSFHSTDTTNTQRPKICSEKIENLRERNHIQRCNTRKDLGREYIETLLQR